MGILLLHRAGVLVLLLWVGGLGAFFATRGKLSRPVAPFRPALIGIFARFLVLAPALTLATWLVFPHLFLSMPRQRPWLWAAIMLLYPLLSVWPQEMLFRRFLFRRYRPLFHTDSALILASAIAFGFAHIIFLNGIAIVLTTAGGWLFARDYARHNRLLLSCLEHSLYGCLIFTIGLGRFFYTGTAWSH